MEPELPKFPKDSEGHSAWSKGHFKLLTQGDTGEAQ